MLSQSFSVCLWENPDVFQRSFIRFSRAWSTSSCPGRGGCTSCVAHCGCPISNFILRNTELTTNPCCQLLLSSWGICPPFLCHCLEYPKPVYTVVWVTQSVQGQGPNCPEVTHGNLVTCRGPRQGCYPEKLYFTPQLTPMSCIQKHLSSARFPEPLGGGKSVYIYICAWWLKHWLRYI